PVLARTFLTALTARLPEYLPIISQIPTDVKFDSQKKDIDSSIHKKKIECISIQSVDKVNAHFLIFTNVV
ncbi:MAG: hypothetical protein WCS78_02375, partial [Bacilli bacterium]